MDIEYFKQLPLSELGTAALKEKALLSDFQHHVWDFYAKNPRTFYWREHPEPYIVYVSEIMLQQTQVSRVEKKFLPFLHRFPDFATLATASFGEVLEFWSGLGYNRRCMNLHQGAKRIVEEFRAELPRERSILLSFKGIGDATAGSMLCFAYNLPEPFIETNIRRVFIHTFFQNRENVSDRELEALVRITTDRKKPREWYYALQDLGAAMVKISGNPNRRSAGYNVQKPFKDSNREARGAILKVLTKRPGIYLTEIARESQISYERIQHACKQLLYEGFIAGDENTGYRIKS
jgi:A/G-specific adenine glycosylase